LRLFSVFFFSKLCDGSFLLANKTILDRSFGHWFAGFTDGDGCFSIARVHDCFICRFYIALRADDASILYEIQDRLGLGVVYHRKTPSRKVPDGYVASPQKLFTVFKKPECIILRDVFRNYPLRTKKAEDFRIWSQAIDLWIEHKFGDSWTGMADLKNQLNAGKKYKVVS
jgi:LAGLIDADG endonuclease